MDRRKKVGLIFSYNENWIGGTYYMVNLIHALNHLEDIEKPLLYIITGRIEDFEYVVKETSYPYLEFRKNRFKRVFFWNYLTLLIKKFFNTSIYFAQVKDEFDFIFPVADSYSCSLIPDRKKCYWIPDFQENYYSSLFSDQDVISRKCWQIEIAVKAHNLVVSSESVKRDFVMLYPFSTVPLTVIPFAVTHTGFRDLDFDAIRSRFNITGEYFYYPSQFWVHKNHRVIIDAVALLKARGLDFTVIFSGKEHDFRQPHYIDEVKAYVKEKGVEPNFRFLGFIDRKELLQLMDKAVAIIQPSLFEGWSTVVEDAKALNKFVIASNIDVHKEQISVNGVFFSPDNASELAEIISSGQFGLQACWPYVERVKDFGRKFMLLID